MKQTILFTIATLLAGPAVAQTQTVEADLKKPESQLVQPMEYNSAELNRQAAKYKINDDPSIELNEYLVLGKSKGERIRFHHQDDHYNNSSWGLVFRIKFMAQVDR